MRLVHLHMAEIIWCENVSEDDITDCTDDPRDATCVDCLRKASAYGAAAAMRCAAVEAGGGSDPELEKERDEALRHLNAITDALESQRAFFCNDCLKLKRVDERAMTAGKLSWCDRCAPRRPKVIT